MKNHSIKIAPYLWFDTEAKEAAEFYCSLFSDSKVTNVTTLRDTPSGDCDVVSFELAAHPFMAISAGPQFKFNPSISFIVGCDSADEVNRLWEKLFDGGSVLMELGEYPFSDRYGWVQDRYNLSWQLIHTSPEGEERPRIVPSLLFGGRQCGRAEEAIDFYLSVFENSKPGVLARYGPDQPLNEEGTIMFSDFKLENYWFAAMDTTLSQEFTFNEAISFMVSCNTQEEIDYFWRRLSAVPEAEQCGWLKDKFGVSWQIVPVDFDEVMQAGSQEEIARLTNAALKMKKFDIEKLKRAYAGAKH